MIESLFLIMLGIITQLSQIRNSDLNEKPRQKRGLFNPLRALKEEQIFKIYAAARTIYLVNKRASRVNRKAILRGADLKHLGATIRTNCSGCWLTVFEGNPFKLIDVFLGAALDTVKGH